MNKHLKLRFSSLTKNICIFFSVILLFFCLNLQAPLAHRPHDVIEKVELSPNYASDRTLFIVVRGNIFKSNDGGETWQRLVKGLDNKFYLSYLAMSPQSENILFSASRDEGIYKSQDGGNSWTKVNNGLGTLNIDLIVVSPSSSEFVLAAGKENGLYKTDNGGQSWKQIVKDNKITAIAFSPKGNDKIVIGDNQGILYISNNQGEEWKQTASFNSSGAITSLAFSPNFNSDKTFWVGTEKEGIFQTVDGGISLTKANQGLLDKSIIDLTISSQDNQNFTIWASTWHEGLFISQDRGKTWQKKSQGLTKEPQADQMKVPHFRDVVISNGFNLDKTIFMGGFNGLFKSTDGGDSWQEIDSLSRGTVVGIAISPNYENDSTIALVTYVGSIYLSNDKGVTWKGINNGLEIPRFTGDFQEVEINQDPRRFYDVAFSSNFGSDNILLATTLWTKFLQSNNGGNYWNIIPLSKTVRGITIAVSPNFATDQTVYLANQQGLIYKSTDGGQKFSLIAQKEPTFGNDSPSIVISPDFADDRTLYASGGKGGIYKSVDGGKTWQLTNEGSDLIGRIALQLAISPNYKVDRTVFVGTYKGLFATRDGGQNWSQLEDTAYGEDSYIEGVAMSPNYQEDRTFIVSVRGKGLYKTVDGGQTFTSIGDNLLPLSRLTNVPSASIPIQFSPSYATDQTIYGFGSAETEVYQSTDGGETWEMLPVTVTEETNSNLINSIRLVFDVYRNKILRILIALIAAVIGYLFVGYLGLEKKLPFSKWQLKVATLFTVFVAALIILFAFF